MCYRKAEPICSFTKERKTGGCSSACIVFTLTFAFNFNFAMAVWSCVLFFFLSLYRSSFPRRGKKDREERKRKGEKGEIKSHEVVAMIVG